MNRIIIFSVFIFLAGPLFAQYSQYQFNDSSKSVYPFMFPLFGDKAHENGFDLPYPAGVMVNYFWANQDIVIPEIAIGFHDGLLPNIPLTDITHIVEFETVNASATTVNIRPDLWVLPFLNVYGVFGKTYATTQVELSYPIELKALAELEGTSFGFGTTGAFGIGKYFTVLDGNWVWSNMSNFDEPVQSSVFSFRFGRALPIGKHPERNIALWAGGMRVRMGSTTQGAIRLRDVLPAETWDRRDQLVNDYYAWYETVDPIKQQLANKVLTPIVENIANSDGSGTIEYKLEKKPAKEWNMIIGGQFQVNKRWQIRSEGGILGNRKSFLASVNYRFGI